MSTQARISRYGWKPQKPDPRDHSFNLEEHILTASQLPAKVDPLSAGIGAYDQLQLGSCVGNGVAGALEYAQLLHSEGEITPSRLFIYGGARQIEGTYPTDSGAEIRDGIKTIASLGAPPETLWPYSDASPGPFNAPIPQSVYDAAVAHEAIRYRALTLGPGAPFRSAIASGRPIVFGFSVPASFEDGSWNPLTDVLALPGPAEGTIGGHCVLADGYDFTRADHPEPFWWCRNSWGGSWGATPPGGQGAGWFRMHYRYFSMLASDFWVVENVK